MVSSVWAKLWACCRTDRARDTRLAASMLMYLDQGYNAKATAARLAVHINTLNNRLTTANALLGSPEAPGRRLALHLALRLAALQAGA